MFAATPQKAEIQMTTENTTPDSFESMIELDLPVAAPAPATLPTAAAPTVSERDHRAACTCNPPPLSVRGICPSCNLPRATMSISNGRAITRGPVVDAATAAEAKRLDSERIAAERAEAQRVAALRISERQLIAGAAAEGHGILTGWDGRGSMTRTEVIVALGAGGFPLDWAPEAKSAHAQAGRAINALNSLGFVVRADRTKSQKRAKLNLADTEFAEMVARDAKEEGQHRRADAIMTTDAGGVATWRARWMIGTTSTQASVGGAYGDVVMVATLDNMGKLWLDSKNTQIADRVRADFESSVASENYSAADISDWLKSTLVSRFRAARVGGNYYVKHTHAEAAERFLTAFARRWGQNWLIPALPVATSEQLRTGIASGLAREVDDVLTEYRDAVTKAKSESREMGARLASSLHDKLRTLAERAAAFSLLLGAHHVHGLREQCIAASDEIQTSMSDIQIRFGNIFDELARDAARREGRKS